MDEAGIGATAARARRALLIAVVLGLSACSNAPVVPSTQFPKPILRKVPVAMGLYMDPAFTNYVHHDKQPNRPVQDVAVGGASKALFAEFLTAQFDTLATLPVAPSAESPPRGVQAVLQPVVEEVQIASPKTEKDEFHEAWIKYRLRLLTPQGQELTSWELAAYGKHRGQAIGGTNAGLTAAVRDAMRDAAAGMALIFRNGDAFRARLNAAAPAAAQAAPAGEAIQPPPPPPAGSTPPRTLPPKSPGATPLPGPVPGRPGSVGIQGGSP